MLISLVLQRTLSGCKVKAFLPNFKIYLYVFIFLFERYMFPVFCIFDGSIQLGNT